MKARSEKQKEALRRTLSLPRTASQLAGLAQGRAIAAKKDRSPKQVAAALINYKTAQARAAKSEVRISRSRAVTEKWWIIKSPRNVVYEFKNLRQFALSNMDLFGTEFTLKQICQGISSIRATRREVKGSWHGWTWVSITERLDGCIK